MEVRYGDKQQAFTDGFTRRWANYNSQRTEVPPVAATTSDTCTKLRWPLLDNYEGETRTALVNMALGSAQNAKDNVAFNKLDLGTQNENINKHKKEWHKKFTLSIACLIFFFICAPLGSIIRKGGLGLPVVVSVLFFVIYYIISTVAERTAEYGDLNMFLGVWLSSLIILPVGLFLTIKATKN